MEKIFAITDNKGKYVDKTCLYYDKVDKKVIYDSYDNYISSVSLYYGEDADKWIAYLTEKAKEFGLKRKFIKQQIIF